MKKTILITAILIASVCALSCNLSVAINAAKNARVKLSGEDTTLVFDVPAIYTGISAFSAVKVTYSGEVDRLTVTLDKALAPYFKFSVKEDDLSFGIKAVSCNSYEMPQVLVPYSAAGLEEVDLSGACSFTSDKVLEGREVDFDLSGASKAMVEVNVTELSADLSGASKLEVRGNAAEADFDVSGASKVTCLDDEYLKAGDVEVEISGASKVAVKGTCFRGDVSGASKLYGNSDAVRKVSFSGASKFETL